MQSPDPFESFGDRPSARVHRRWWLILGAFLLANLVALAIALALGHRGPAPLADIPMTDHHGRQVTFRDFRGKWVIAYFGYTHCPDACPTGLGQLTSELKGLGEDAQRVQVLFISVDPRRDTVAQLAAYLPYFNSAFLGIRIPEPQLAAVAKEFGVAYFPSGKGKDYTIDHTVNFYLIDPQGRLKTNFQLPLPAGTLKRYLDS